MQPADNMSVELAENYSNLTNGTAGESPDQNSTTSEDADYQLNRQSILQYAYQLEQRYKTNRFFDWPIQYTFILAYGLLIVFGTIGNCLAMSAGIRKPSMRTPRNLFIINLAVADLLLCVLTMPVTLMQLLAWFWPLGNNWIHVVLCKLFGCLQAISIFVSTMSITAIALDRYHVIVYPTQASMQTMGTVFALIGIWTLACVLAAPLFIWMKLEHHKEMLPQLGSRNSEYPEQVLYSVDFCVEDWPIANGRAYYSIFVIILQYAVPIVVVSVAYAKICKKLRYRMRPGGRTCVETSIAGGNGTTGGSRISANIRSGSIQRDRDHARVRRTNSLLISIALIFGISWMPLNVFNVIVDVFEPFDFGNYNDQFYYRVIYAICHLTGMSSACSNPLLYGWLNENFRKEYIEIWCCVKSCQACGCKRGDSLSRSLSRRESRPEREQTTVHYRKKNSAEAEGEIEQSTLITQVLDRHK